jgi:hypothetical protein
MQYAFGVLQEANPDFCRRFSEQHRGRKRLWIARDQKGFRAGEKVAEGWYIETGLGAEVKVDRIKKACGVVEVSYGDGKDMFVRIGGHS